MAANFNSLPGSVLQLIAPYFNHPFAEGSRAIRIPDFFLINPNTREIYRTSRIRLWSTDLWPKDIVGPYKYQTRAAKAQYKASRIAIKKADSRAMDQAIANGNLRDFKLVMRPVPFFTGPPAHLDVLRPRRCWVLDFPDLKSLVGYLEPGGPGTDARLSTVRIIQLTWIDDATLHWSEQVDVEPEYAYEAMEVLQQKQSQGLLPQIQRLRIYFPDTNRPNGARKMIKLDSPGIFHLLQLRGLLQFTPIDVYGNLVDPNLKHLLCRELVTNAALNPWAPHLVNGVDELRSPRWNIGMVGAAGGQTQVQRQYTILERQYRCKHYRLEIMARYWRRRLKTAEADRDFAERLWGIPEIDDADLDEMREDEADAATAANIKATANRLAVEQRWRDIAAARQTARHIAVRHTIQDRTLPNADRQEKAAGLANNSATRQLTLRLKTYRSKKQAEARSTIPFMKRKLKHVKTLYQDAERGVDAAGKRVDSASLRDRDRTWLREKDKRYKWNEIPEIARLRYEMIDIHRQNS